MASHSSRTPSINITPKTAGFVLSGQGNTDEIGYTTMELYGFTPKAYKNWVGIEEIGNLIKDYDENQYDKILSILETNDLFEKIGNTIPSAERIIAILKESDSTFSEGKNPEAQNIKTDFATHPCLPCHSYTGSGGYLGVDDPMDVSLLKDKQDILHNIVPFLKDNSMPPPGTPQFKLMNDPSKPFKKIRQEILSLTKQ